MAGFSPSTENRGRKRRRTAQYDPITGETDLTPNDVGYMYLNQLRHTKDKRGQLVATQFITLPDPRDFPDYYEMIRLPVALETMEAKLNQGLYHNVSQIEADAKRMITNAKEYNEKSSEVYQDAERIRKMTSEFMKKNNPAYANPNYKALPTPLPGEETYGYYNGMDMDAHGDLDTEMMPVMQQVEGQGTKRKRGRPRLDYDETPQSMDPTNGKSGRESLSPTPSSRVSGSVSEGFEGKSFQKAQEKLIAELINWEGDGEDHDSALFLNLPPRALRDYYQVIKNPTSLKGLEKRVLGVLGKNKVGSGISEFQTWDAFANAVNVIWSNAREYNEEESFVWNLAGELEAFFLKRLKAAKQAVPEPNHPKVKLNMSTQPKIMLRVGGQTAGSPVTPSASINSAAPGMAVDNGALQRQQQHIQAGMNGYGRQPYGVSGSLAADARSPSLTANGVKGEGSNSRPSSRGATTLVRNSSGPYAQSPGNVMSMQPPVGQSPQPEGIFSQPSTVNLPKEVVIPGYNTRWRGPGKGAADTLFSNLRFNTHPNLRLADPAILFIPADEKKADYGKTIWLPSSHNSAQVTFGVSPNVGQRDWRYYCTVNNKRLTPVNDNTRVPLFEFPLEPGSNVVVVEIIAGPPRGTPRGPGMEVELEKVTIFPNLHRFDDY